MAAILQGSVLATTSFCITFVLTLQMHLNGRNMANVYDKIEMSMLPDEYLPDDYKGPSAGPAKQIVGKSDCEIVCVCFIDAQQNSSDISVKSIEFQRRFFLPL